jgi:hypothetical protein
MRIETIEPAIRDRQQAIASKVCPWLADPYTLVNWWDMKPFPVGKFLSYARGFQEMVSESSQRQEEVVYNDESRKGEIQAMEDFIAESEEYSLTSTGDQFYRMKRAFEKGAGRKEIDKLLPELLNRLEDECRRRRMLMIEPEHVKYAEDPQFFDPTDPTANKVSTELSSASEDIAEAGMCLACGRSTACVMHLSRVVECGLEALAKALGVTKQNDWGQYLNQIDVELQKRFKSAGARSLDEQFYAEVHITFDAVRRAWRNPTMHVDKTYTPERAEEIMVSVRSFMRHLATKLHD